VSVVLAGGGLQQVGDRLVELLDGAVFVTSPDGRVLAESGRADRLSDARASGCFDPSGRLRTEHLRVGVQA
jgi:purine catabolism regulator